VAVLDIGEFGDACLNPIIDGDFTAGRTEARLAGMRDFFGLAAFRADILVKTESFCFAGKDFVDVFNDGRTD